MKSQAKKNPMLHVEVQHRLVIPERPEWFDRASCHGRTDLTEVFYEDYMGTEADKASFLVRNARARAICDGCPVAIDCVEWGNRESDWHGIRGAIPGNLRKRWHQKEGLSTRQMLSRVRQPYPRSLLALAVGPILAVALGAVGMNQPVPAITDTPVPTDGTPTESPAKLAS